MINQTVYKCLLVYKKKKKNTNFLLLALILPSLDAYAKSRKKQIPRGTAKKQFSLQKNNKQTK